jgi:hypothetical protein
MTKYNNKPRQIEAITFEELIAFGKAHTDEFINGMPKSFKYNGHLIEYLNEHAYLIPTLESGDWSQIFTANDMLIIGIKGEIYPCKKDIFTDSYDPD